MAELTPPCDKRALIPPHFPDVQYAVVFRNWGILPAERIAAALCTDTESISRVAARMGLSNDKEPDERFLSRGFLTVIRNNWHLLDYEALCRLLNISKEKLTFILKEDDFFWVKMGYLKPDTGIVRWHEPTEAELSRLDEIRALLKSSPLGDLQENAYNFLDDFHREIHPDEIVTVMDGDLRLIYSYFALYGDPLLTPELDPYPDALLQEYAKLGVNGIWMQGILYQLVEHSLCPEMSKDCEKRIQSLRELCRRAARFGIRVYFYFNEPRSLPKTFFEKNPHLAGKNGDETYTTLCTSTPEVQAYLEDAMYRLFSAVPELGGYFTITRSENPTTCYSHDVAPCENCAPRGAATVISEVNNLLYRGMRRASKTARAFAWTWGWKPEWAKEAISKLDSGITLMNTSETAIPTNFGGVKGEVIDYSISQVGPGELAKSLWNTALETRHACAAKVQINNSWELSPVPYLPVFSLVYEHMHKLKASGVSHLMLSWTLGGSPAPNLYFADQAMNSDADLVTLLRDYYGDAADTILQADRKFCAAFREFPFDMFVLYFAPLQLGVAAPFYKTATGYEASMTGFPYDDLKKWRRAFTEDIFEEQFARLSKGWKEGLNTLDTIEFATERVCELKLFARAALSHFASTYNHIRFLRARNRGDTDAILSVLNEEEEALLTLAEARRTDCRIGFEAANHYFYTVRDLQEKLLNLHDCKQHFANGKKE